METCEKACLLLLSGGKDSFLSACRLIEEGYKLFLITYDNGCGLQIENVKHANKILIDRYGKDTVESLGIRSICGIWRNFFLPIYNMTPNQISKEYGQITYSQLNCLTCRTAMYIYSILICTEKGIPFIAEGARRDQGFVIEQDVMIDNYRSLLKKHNIELLTPVFEVTDNWLIKNEILMSNFTPKTHEPQCLIGVPLDKPVLDEEVINGTVNFYKKSIEVSIDNIVNLYKNKILDTRGDLDVYRQ